MKMPALQFYPADWRKDLAVQALGYFDRGVWFEMLCLMHESSERGVLLLNGTPMAEEVVARVLGLDNQTFNLTLTTLLTYGVARRRESDGAIFNKRMVEDEKLCEKRRKAGKMGGNPILLNQNPTTPVKQKPTPSSSSSSSSSEDKVAAGDILTYLNEQASRNYKPLPASIKLIVARLNEGATVDECKAVVDAKVTEWRDDSKMRAFLRPATLFNAMKFANYVGELSTGAGTRPAEKDYV
ncbi:MAG: conserved phage C-terminal domain-containing protein [Massilia sp.]